LPILAVAKQIIMKEVWKKVIRPDFNPKVNLWISNYGRIKSFRTKKIGGKILSGTHISNYKVTFVETVDGKRKTLFVHKLVAELFLLNTDKNKNFVIHKDYDLLNNYVGNLQWATKEEVGRHKLENPNNKNRTYYTKLTQSDVDYIRKRVVRNKREGRDLYASLARKFGVSITHIKRIVERKNWK
jgi:Mor family transcriptional regulator